VEEEGRREEEGKVAETTEEGERREEGIRAAIRKNRRQTPRSIRRVVVRPADRQSTPGGQRLRAMKERAMKEIQEKGFYPIDR
jgi:hypothetical protein